MPKVGVEKIRRRQLIDAAYHVLHEEGYNRTTLAKISAKAGLSTSIINHYFVSKDALIEAVTRDLVATLLREVSSRMRQASTPVEKVLAVVDGNFAPSQCTPQAVSAWLFFWSQVPYEPRLARIQRICDKRLLAYLSRPLKDLLPNVDDAEDIAQTIMTLSYGFWLQFAHYTHTFDPNKAHRLALDVVTSCIQRAWADLGRLKAEQASEGLS